MVVPTPINIHVGRIPFPLPRTIAIASTALSRRNWLSIRAFRLPKADRQRR
jgi:hypothetical protein